MLDGVPNFDKWIIIRLQTCTWLLLNFFVVKEFLFVHHNEHVVVLTAGRILHKLCIRENTVLSRNKPTYPGFSPNSVVFFVPTQFLLTLWPLMFTSFGCLWFRLAFSGVFFSKETSQSRNLWRFPLLLRHERKYNIFQAQETAKISPAKTCLSTFERVYSSFIILSCSIQKSRQWTRCPWAVLPLANSHCT